MINKENEYAQAKGQLFGSSVEGALLGHHFTRSARRRLHEFASGLLREKPLIPSGAL
jgi:hypothetical protein